MSTDAYLIRLALVGPSTEVEIRSWFDDPCDYYNWWREHRERLAVDYGLVDGWWVRTYTAASPSEPSGSGSTP